jgi:hypothetical protein
VQWNLLTYDAGGNPKLSGAPTSGAAYHYFGPCSLNDVDELIQTEQLPEAAGQPLISGALALLAQLQH